MWVGSERGNQFATEAHGTSERKAHIARQFIQQELISVKGRLVVDSLILVVSQRHGLKPEFRSLVIRKIISLQYQLPLKRALK